MKFVLFHGAFGSPEKNWFPDVKDKLISLGQEVIVPRFPVEDWSEITRLGTRTPLAHQTLQNWMNVFIPIAKTFKKEDRLCFIGHSIAPVFILHVVSTFHIQLDSAFFVCPFMTWLKSEKFWQFDFVNAGFYKTDFDFQTLRKLIPISYVLRSDNDPYVPIERCNEFVHNLGSKEIVIHNGAHLNDETGWTSFPLLVDLCKQRIDYGKDSG